MPNFRDFHKRLKMPTKARIRSLFTKKRVAIAGGIFAAFLILTPVLTYAYYARDIRDRERLMNHNNTGVVLKDKSGEIFYEYGRINDNDDVPLSAISDHVKEALIASEDKDFYKHEGFDITGIARAIYGNVLNRDATRYGGSTITQQLVKNTLLSSNKNYFRKYQEVSMAVAVERHYSKDEILDMYLNSVYFGEGAFGIADAAKTYFGKSPADLTLAESSMLIGLLPAPNAYSPISGDEEVAAKQQQRVLSKMAELEYITADEKQIAADVQLSYAEGAASTTFEHAQHYALMVLEQLNDEYGEERVTRSGFEVTTALDLSAQKEAEATVQRRIAVYEDAGGRNAGLVAIDPKTGEVRALVGSVDWDNESFGKVNMTVTPRQPGSSFKPIYYTEALDKKKITAATILHDEPRTFGSWQPQNYDFRFRGDISVRNALALSLNIPAIEVLEKVGVRDATLAAQRMGITTVDQPDKYGLTLAVGTAETKLYEMTNAYAAFANKGEQFEPVMVTEIKNKFDDTVFKHEQREGEHVVSEEAAFVISSILSDNPARAPLYGSSLNIPGRQAAVKTGTTDENKDAWTIGYTPGLAVGVWVGNNENEPMRGIGGGTSAGMIWRDTIIDMTEDTPVERFEIPSGVQQMQVCRGTELRAASSGSNTYTEYFIEGTAPKSECNARRPAEQQPAQKLREQEQEQPETEDENENGSSGPGNGDTPPTTPTQPTTPTTPTTPSEPGTDEGGRGGEGEDPGSGNGTDDEPATPPSDGGGVSPQSGQRAPNTQ
jgi:penicillin-binding protein 1A